MLKNYLTIALRNLRRHKVISFINIAGLAIGLAMFMLIALYIQHELSFDKFHENGDRICRVEQILDHKTYKEASAGCPAALSKSLMADFPEFEAVSRVILWGNIILTVSDNQKIRQRAFYADSAFFKIFSFPGIKGDLTTALDAPYSVVLTQAVAEKVFGEQDPLGKNIRFFDDDQDHKVTGVIQNVPQNSHFTFDLLISSVSITAGRDRDPFEAWHDNWVPLYVLLHPEQPW